MASAEIYIGSRIEHASERDVFEWLVNHLSREKREAIILANIQFGGRQIDLVVAMNGLTLVIEAKGHVTTLRGGHNGPWEFRVASDG